MSVTYTNNLKALACLLIFVHHYYMRYDGIVQILGFWMVSIFLCFLAMDL